MVARSRRLPVPASVAVLASVFAIATPTAHAASCPGADLVPVSGSPAVAQGATLCLLNDERTSRGLAPLRSQAQLESAAAAYSLAMVQQRFFSHVSPSGEALEQRLRAYISAVTTWDIGENLAWGEGGHATPKGIVGGWMRSDGHRANILNTSFREVGIGIAAGTPGGAAPESSATYTAEFGSRLVDGAEAGAGAHSGPAADPAASSAAARPPASSPAARKPATKVSASKKRWIKAQCARVARKTSTSRKARKARAARCVQQQLKAAERR